MLCTDLLRVIVVWAYDGRYTLLGALSLVLIAAGTIVVERLS